MIIYSLVFTIAYCIAKIHNYWNNWSIRDFFTVMKDLLIILWMLAFTIFIIFIF